MALSNILRRPLVVLDATAASAAASEMAGIYLPLLWSAPESGALPWADDRGWHLMQSCPTTLMFHTLLTSRPFPHLDTPRFDPLSVIATASLTSFRALVPFKVISNT